MKVVILAGGYGSRLSEYTKTIPKPIFVKTSISVEHVLHIHASYARLLYHEALLLKRLKS